MDRVWKNATPPPDYIITETKFGGATLNKRTDQMSNTWVNKGLDKLKEQDLADKLREALNTGDVEKRLLTVDRATGAVTSTVLKQFQAK